MSWVIPYACGVVVGWIVWGRRARKLGRIANEALGIARQLREGR